jgi:hypothetical protein
MWAKPQPAGATAVLVINNLPTGTFNETATFSMEEVRFDATKGAKVFDIWSQAVVGEIPAVGDGWI